MVDTQASVRLLPATMRPNLALLADGKLGARLR
jgi:hypothetical protein